MRVQQSQELAQQWVDAHAQQIPGFQGAFLHGSSNWLPAESELPANSDIDLMIVLAAHDPPVKIGKVRYHTALLEISYLASERIQTPEYVLSDYHLAGNLHTARILADPSGHLAALQAAVRPAYAQRQWVRRRCEHARNNILRNIQQLNPHAPLHEQVTAWLFAAGVTTHVLLVAGLRNPTVRRRYLAVRELLQHYQLSAEYEPLLDLLGCAQLSQAHVQQQLDILTVLFDVAKTVIKTPFFFASDISDFARPIAIDGSQELIARGDHREAVFWIIATASRCQAVLYHDADAALQARFQPNYQALLADLGIYSTTDLQQRSAQIVQFLPHVWSLAETILAANPAITD